MIVLKEITILKMVNYIKVVHGVTKKRKIRINFHKIKKIITFKYRFLFLKVNYVLLIVLTKKKF